ncbi:Early nodulin-like protein 1 [Rhynchospora pubera]|uniref:Early nodulin-like protein 1 n=1 Tax=Rhynchospora pubera TaxID=906938 RepID=A0AAV8D1Z0_9POAL|nr:Early nodulin-like protein 1 [Rhynchospora pubera]
MSDRMNLVMLLVLILCCGSARAVIFEVGGSERWAIPSEGDMYNRWASDKIFQVGDILRFRYKNDSVLVVSQEDYEKCYIANPIKAYYGQNTHYWFDWSGYFYFISGELRHCELGQKMAIDVKSSDTNGSPPLPPCPPSNATRHICENSEPLSCYSRLRANRHHLYFI